MVAYEIRYFGPTVAGVCNFDELRYQRRKEIRRGTRAGSIGIYCAREAIADAGLDWENVDKSTVGIYIGVTEHGNVETENEIYLLKGFNYDTQFWSHHHNPRTVANNPAGEISLNLGITGPHYTIGAACAAGNAGMIQGVQMLRLGECDLALAGGVSESIRTFGIFASFHSQGALARHDDPTKASRPFDVDRNGIVVAEGGCIFVLERLTDARARGAKIYGEIVGYAMNSDARDFVLPRSRAAGRVHPPGPAAGRAGAGGHRHRQHARHGHHQRRRPGVRGAAAGLRRAAAARCSTTPRASSATRWARPGRWNWPAICPPSTTASATPRSTSTGVDPEMRLAGAGGQPAAGSAAGATHPEQFVRHVGDQFGGRSSDGIQAATGECIRMTAREMQEITGRREIEGVDILTDITPGRRSERV